jgi:predicted DNA-binding transcriptional regulator AlpA
VRPQIAALIDLVRTIPVGELPEFIGDVEQVKATAWTRLTMSAFREPEQPDRLIDIDEASELLGMSKSYLYRHHEKFPFTKREGRKLLFSLAGIRAYIGRKESLTPRRLRPMLRPVG